MKQTLLPVFDGFFACAVGAGNRLREGIAVYDHQINRWDAVQLASRNYHGKFRVTQSSRGDLALGQLVMSKSSK